MSDSLMPFHPAIDEPSNILPSSKKLSSTVLAGTVTCCSLPRVSVSRKSTNLTPLSFIICNTSAADMVLLHSCLELPAICSVAEHVLRLGAILVQYLCQSLVGR